MPAVVAIHNAVNERAWAHVLAWEAMRACECPEPKLLRFKGRPTDYSPKARLLNLLVRVMAGLDLSAAGRRAWGGGAGEVGSGSQVRWAVLQHRGVGVPLLRAR